MQNVDPLLGVAIRVEAGFLEQRPRKAAIHAPDVLAVVHDGHRRKTANAFHVITELAEMMTVPRPGIEPDGDGTADARPPVCGTLLVLAEFQREVFERGVAGGNPFEERVGIHVRDKNEGKNGSRHASMIA